MGVRLVFVQWCVLALRPCLRLAGSRDVALIPAGGVANVGVRLEVKLKPLGALMS